MLYSSRTSTRATAAIFFVRPDVSLKLLLRFESTTPPASWPNTAAGTSSPPANNDALDGFMLK